MAKKISGITVEIGGDTTKLGKALGDVNKSSRDLQGELKGVEKLLKLDPKNVELVRQKQELLKESIAKTSEKLNTLKSVQEQVQTQFDKGEITVEQYRDFQREIVMTEQKLQALENEAKNLGKTLEQSLDNAGQKIQKFGDNISDVGKSLLPVTAAVTGVGIAASTMAVGFEDSMANINTLLSDTSSLEVYEEAIVDFSRKSGKDLGDVSAGMYQAISSIGDLGEETTSIFNVMGTSAKAGGAEVSDSVSLISAGMKGYNDINEESAQKISDLAFQTTKLGVTTFPELARSMQPLFPLSSALGFSMEELFGSMATLTGVTGNTSEVTTQLKAVFSNLMKPTTDMAAIIENYGYANAQAMIETEGLSGVLRIIQQETGGQADKLAELFSSTEAVTAVTALTGSQFDTFNEKLGEMQNATGATDSALQKIEDTTGNKLRTSLNDIQVTMTDLGGTILEMLIPVFEKISDAIKRFADWFNTADDSTKKIIVSIGGFIAVLGPALIVIGKVVKIFGQMVSASSKVVKGLKMITDGTALATVKTTALGIAQKASVIWTNAVTAAQWLLNAAMAANPIGIVIVLIGALIAGLIYLWTTNEDFRNALISAWEAIKNAGFAVWEWLVKFFTEDLPAAWEAVKQWFAGLPEWFAGLWDSVVAKFQEWGDNITSFFTETIPGWIQSIGDWFNELPEKIGFAIGYALGTIIQWGVDVWTYLTTNVPIWIESVVTFFSELPGKIWTWLVGVYNNVIQWGSDMWAKVTEVATTFVQKAVTFFSELPGKIWTWLVDTYNRVVAWGSDLWQKAKEIASTFVNNIITFVKELPGKIWTWFTETANKVVNFGRDAGTKAKEAGGKIVDNVINAVKNLPSQIFDIGKNIVQGLWNGITSMGSWIGEKVSGFFGGIVDGAKKALGIHSPSRVFRDQVGRFMAQGVGVGFEVESDNVEEDMKNSLRTLTARVGLGAEAAAQDAGSATMVNMMAGRSVFNSDTHLVNDNSNVISRLERLVSMFDQFVNQAMPSYQVVMDTGVLVGELAPGVNQELARASEYRERGR